MSAQLKPRFIGFGVHGGRASAYRLSLYFLRRGKQPPKRTEKGGFLELGAWKRTRKGPKKEGMRDLSILDLGLRISDCRKKIGRLGDGERKMGILREREVWKVRSEMNVQHRTFNMERRMGKYEETEELIKIFPASIKTGDLKQN